jgi:hypothetical protein
MAWSYGIIQGNIVLVVVAEPGQTSEKETEKNVVDGDGCLGRQWGGNRELGEWIVNDEDDDE